MCKLSMKGSRGSVFIEFAFIAFLMIGAVTWWYQDSNLVPVSNDSVGNSEYALQGALVALYESGHLPSLWRFRADGKLEVVPDIETILDIVGQNIKKRAKTEDICVATRIIPTQVYTRCTDSSQPLESNYFPCPTSNGTRPWGCAYLSSFHDINAGVVLPISNVANIVTGEIPGAVAVGGEAPPKKEEPPSVIQNPESGINPEVPPTQHITPELNQPVLGIPIIYGEH